MIKHIVQCDQCPKWFSFTPLTGDQQTPPEWFTLFQGPNIHAQEGRHFCSLSCLHTWTVERHNGYDFVADGAGGWYYKKKVEAEGIL